MLSVKDIYDLLNFRADDGAALSVYLELGGPEDPVRALKALLKDAAQKQPLLQGLEPDLKRIERFVEAFQRESHRGLALFSAKKGGLWQACPLPQPVKTAVRAGPELFLSPLTNLLDQYHRYGVALVSQDSARFLEVFLGQAEDLGALGDPPVKGKARAPVPLHLRLKAVSDRLLRLTRSRKLERIVLGAPEALEAPLISHLHSSIQDNLIIDTQMGPEMPVKDVLQKVMSGETQSRIVRESVLVYRLLDAVKSGGMGVVGLFDTLGALRRGQIRMLLVRDSLVKMGRACTGCRALFLEGKKCDACGAALEPVFNLIGEIAQQALEQDCEVFRVLHDERLNALGGIGAELRFASTKAPPGGLALPGTKMV